MDDDERREIIAKVRLNFALIGRRLDDFSDGEIEDITLRYGAIVLEAIAKQVGPKTVADDPAPSHGQG